MLIVVLTLTINVYAASMGSENYAVSTQEITSGSEDMSSSSYQNKMFSDFYTGKKESENYKSNKGFVYTLYVEAAAAAAEEKGSGSVAARSGGIIYECYEDSDCETNQACLNRKCVSLFDVKVINVESPIEQGQFFNFTYLIKGMANISGDVIVEFWVEKDKQKVTSGSDTIYLGSYEEKTETASLFLPTYVVNDEYDFYVMVTYLDYKAKAYRKIEVGKGIELNVDIKLEELPSIKEEEVEFSVVLMLNKYEPVDLRLEMRITKDNETVWYKEGELTISRSIVIKEKVGKLKAGDYKLEIVAYYGNKTSKLSQSFSIEGVEEIKIDYMPYILLLTLVVVLSFTFYTFYWYNIGYYKRREKKLEIYKTKAELELATKIKALEKATAGKEIKIFDFRTLMELGFLKNKIFIMGHILAPLSELIEKLKLKWMLKALDYKTKKLDKEIRGELDREISKINRELRRKLK